MPRSHSQTSTASIGRSHPGRFSYDIRTTHSTSSAVMRPSYVARTTGTGSFRRSRPYQLTSVATSTGRDVTASERLNLCVDIPLQLDSRRLNQRPDELLKRVSRVRIAPWAPPPTRDATARSPRPSHRSSASVGPLERHGEDGYLSRWGMRGTPIDLYSQRNPKQQTTAAGAREPP